jgi:hypothetical protein
VDIIITLLFIGGGFAEVPARLQPYEFCSDKNYYENSYDVWVHATYNDKKIFASYCKTPDKKYFVSYYDPEWEKNKSLDILD